MKYKILIIITAVIFAAGVAGSIVALNAPKKQYVNIKSGGKVLYTLDLSRESDRTFDVKADSNAAIRKVQEHYYGVFGTK